MPKTTGSVAQSCAKIEIQPGCAGSWYDISGETNTATLPMEVITTGSVAVFGDDRPVIQGGKIEPITASFSIVYTEEADEAWEYLRAIWQTDGCSKLLCTRVTPRGGSVGDLEIYIGSHDPDQEAYLTGLKPPDLDAGAGGPAIGEFQVLGYYDYDVKAS